MAPDSPVLRLAGGWSRVASPTSQPREPSLAANVAAQLTTKRVLAASLLTAASLLCEQYCQPNFGQHKERWKPYAVVDCTVFSILLIADGLPADAVLLGLTVLFVLAGIITERQAFAGFSSPGVVAYAALFILSDAFAEVQILDAVVARCLGNPKSLKAAQFRITLPVALLSAVFNNGPLVAMLVPVVQAWAQRNGQPPSQLLMPLAFASTLGGTLTMIGSAANLLAQDRARLLEPPVELDFLSLTPYSLPLNALGLGCMLLTAPWLLPRAGSSPALPDKSSEMDFGLVDEESATELRSYQISFVVRSRCPSIGRTLHELGLPRMPEVQVLELWRAGQVVPEGLRTPLLHKDIVKVTATAASVARLRRAYDGLEPAVHRDLEILGARRRHRRLFEAVVAPKSQLAEAPLARQKERMLRLGAVILAVRRPGGTPKEAAGAGDVLLLEALPGCLEAAGDFTLVAPVEASKPPRAGKTQDRLRGLLCLLGFLAVILLNGGHLVPLATAVLVLDFLCCFSKVLGWKEAMRSVNGSVILTIAASFGISTALTQTGAASALANALLHVGLHYGPFGVLCMVYAGTALLTNIISNTATCVMMIPVASHVSHQLQATDCPCPFNEKTLLILVILASNSAFATPLGSPCNILVVDAGDYSFSDFLRFGGVLQLMMMVATCCLLYAYPCA